VGGCAGRVGKPSCWSVSGYCVCGVAGWGVLVKGSRWGEGEWKRKEMLEGSLC
jgi:hypothetical protein